MRVVTKTAIIAGLGLCLYTAISTIDAQEAAHSIQAPTAIQGPPNPNDPSHNPVPATIQSPSDLKQPINVQAPTNAKVPASVMIPANGQDSVNTSGHLQNDSSQPVNSQAGSAQQVNTQTPNPQTTSNKVSPLVPVQAVPAAAPTADTRMQVPSAATQQNNTQGPRGRSVTTPAAAKPTSTQTPAPAAAASVQSAPAIPATPATPATPAASAAPATAPSSTAPLENLSEQEILTIAKDAYLYGYPLITMDMTRQVMTNVAEPQGLKSPMGQFLNARAFPDATFKDFTAPNADTLYSIAWLDVSQEPMILHIPEESGRYYLMPMLSGWTDVFASPGTRTTGNIAGDYAITGPSWKGSLPAGVKELKSPTAMVWILGRTYCAGTQGDYNAVHAIQDQYSVVPLRFYGKPYTPPKGVVNPGIDMKTPVRTQVNNLDAKTFFKKLAMLMVANPPSILDSPMIEKMAQIGIESGGDVDFSKLDPVVARSLELAPSLAYKEMMQIQNANNDIINGWHVSLKTGIYGANYLQRAYIAAMGLGANRPQDAVYPYTMVDSDGAPLNGKNRYVLHFAKGQTPPVKGFWSLTMYDKQFFFVNNSLKRYALSPRDDLKLNADGSIDLYIQKDSPTKKLVPNWLPAPKDDFVLMLRLYWPDQSVLDGTWKPPIVQRVK